MFAGPDLGTYNELDFTDHLQVTFKCGISPGPKGGRPVWGSASERSGCYYLYVEMHGE
jgi:hypothetical protein